MGGDLNRPGLYRTEYGGRHSVLVGGIVGGRTASVGRINRKHDYAV